MCPNVYITKEQYAELARSTEGDVDEKVKQILDRWLQEQEDE